MRDAFHPAVRARSLLMVSIMITGLSLTGCIRTYVNCADGSNPEEAGGCYTRAVMPGDTAEGQPCIGGNKCRFENQPGCNSSNPSLKCKTVNKSGSCECKCL